MELKTLVNVTCSENGKVQPYTGLVVGKLLSVQMYPIVKAVWGYYKEDNTLLISDIFTLTNEQANEMLTTPITSMEVAEDVFYNAMRIEMAQTFGIETNQIELC